MLSKYFLELGKAGYVVAKDLCKIQPNESVLITADSVADIAPVAAVAQAAEALGAKVMVALHSTPKGYGKLAEDRLPEPLKKGLPMADVWIEFNTQWLLYSTPWTKAINNGKTRYLFLGGLNREQIVRCIADLNLNLQIQFQNKVVELTSKAKKMRVTSMAGTDVTFNNDQSRPILNELDASTPGAHFLIGQIGWAPLEHTINGRLVFDGSFSGGGEAELGILNKPIEMIIREGKIVEIRGGNEARFVARWLSELNDPMMYYIAHISCGFNPGAKLSGLCTEDERIWGATVWGMGYQGPMFKGNLGDASTHADGICLNCTIWLDDEKMTENGRVVHPELVEIAEQLKK